MPRRPTTAAITLAPDWVCEVLSPGARNVSRDRMIKPDVYHRAGIAWLWLVDPQARLVEVYRREEAGYLRVQTAAGRGEARLEPFDAVAFELSAWWTDAEGEE
ncbi:MAG: Uma2 family endonuclease [Myxococcota bacterium]|jgi:Uma2 family endonuclease